MSIAGLASAAGTDYPGNGTQALARGGAFGAKADDGAATQYNPAGFAKQKGFRLMLHNNLVDEDLTMHRAVADSSGDLDFSIYPSVENTDSIYWIPMFTVSHDFGLQDWTFFTGMFAPHAVGNRTFPRCAPGVAVQGGNDYCGSDDADYAPQRFLITSRELIVIHPVIGVSYRVLSWLDVGAEFLPTVSLVKVDESVNALGQDNHAFEARIDLGDGKFLVDPFTPLFVLGVLARPLDSLEIGLSLKTPGTSRMEGDIGVDISSNLAGIADVAEVAPGALVSDLPWVFRGGVRYVHRRGGFELWDVEVDTTYEAYSDLESIDVEFDPALEVSSDPLGIATKIPVVETLHAWNDVVTVSLGGSYNFQRLGPGELSLRAGGYYEQAAQDIGVSRLDFTGLERYGASGGFAYKWRGYTLGFAYSHAWHRSRTVHHSRLVSEDLVGTACTADSPPDCEPASTVVGNGKFEAAYDIFSIGIDVEFDEVLGRN